jgi:hypothetical protein
VAPARFGPVAQLSQGYATLFQLFMLRFAIVISCAVVLSQSFRGDILEKTLHYYLLAAVRREMIAIGKYVAGVVIVGALFTASTILSNILIYTGTTDFERFFLEDHGLSDLAHYVAAVLLATIAYGAVFLLAGLFFKNPGVIAVFVMAWESLNFALPSTLQMFSVIHYIQGLLPVAIDRGPFAVVTEPTSPLLGIPILLIFACALVAISGWWVRYTQITYSAD